MSRYGSSEAKALIVIQWGDEIWLAKVIPDTLSLDRDIRELPSENGYRCFEPGITHITLNGQLLEAVRRWGSWEEFYAEMVPETLQPRLGTGPKMLTP